MKLHRSLLVATAAVITLARCQCGDPLNKLPTPQIEIFNEAGDSTKTADPWLVVDFGDADSGTSVTHAITVKDVGTAPLLIQNVCLVNAADITAAKSAGCLPAGTPQPFTFTSIASSTPIKVGDSVDMPITFAPRSGGPASLFLQFTSNDKDEPVVAVQLTGRGTDGKLCAEPSGLYDFGDVNLGTTATGAIVVRNCGVKPVTIESWAFAQNPDSAFTFTTDVDPVVGATLAENEAVNVTVTFTPSQPGPYQDARSGDIHVVTAAPFAAEYDLLLVGNGVTPPACRIHVVPSEVQFASVASGTTATRQFVITSVGQCGCSVDAISDPSPAAAGFVLPAPPALPAVLKGTVGCDGDPAGSDTAPSALTVDVQYTAPVQDNSQQFTASLDVTTSDLANPVQTVNLEANGGGAPFCQLQVAPAQDLDGVGFPNGRFGVVDFGRTAVHVPKQEPITLQNIGNIDCHVNGVAYNDEQNTTEHEFSIVDAAGNPATNLGTFAIHPGDTTTLFAVFAPSHTLEADGLFGGAFSFGSYSPTMSQTPIGCHVINTTACNGVDITTDDNRTVVNTNGDLTGVFSIGFKGTPVAPSVDVIPGQLDFGLVTLDCGSPTERVSIYNNGGADLVVDQPTVDPTANPVVFRVEGTSNPTNTWPMSIPAGGALSVEVRYFARVVGLQSANLVVPTEEGGAAGPPITVPLLGTGTTDTSQTDTFDQFGDPKVDVLWVVDDSGSMEPYQDEMATNFTQFFNASHVNNADFHIAVTTTLTAAESCVGGPQTCSSDADCGTGGDCVLGFCNAGSGAVNSCPDDPKCGWYTSCSNEHFLTPTSPNVESQFQCNVHDANGASNPSRPASDSAEGGFRAAYRFLTPENITDPNINGGFLRDDAKLHVIMVSDEPEQSKGGVQEYIDFFQNLKGFRNSSLVSVSAIAPPDDGCTLADGTAVAGDTRYHALVDAMNGRLESICNPDWTSMMSNLGLDSLGLRVEFFLTRAAEEQSITVCVKSSPSASQCVAQTKTTEGAANGWFYDPVDNSVVFNNGSIPPRGSQVVVSYGTFCF